MTEQLQSVNTSDAPFPILIRRDRISSLTDAWLKILLQDFAAAGSKSPSESANRCVTVLVIGFSGCDQDLVIGFWTHGRMSSFPWPLVGWRIWTHGICYRFGRIIARLCLQCRLSSRVIGIGRSIRTRLNLWQVCFQRSNLFFLFLVTTFQSFDPLLDLFILLCPDSCPLLGRLCEKASFPIILFSLTNGTSMTSAIG